MVNRTSLLKLITGATVTKINVEAGVDRARNNSGIIKRYEIWIGWT